MSALIIILFFLPTLSSNLFIIIIIFVFINMTIYTEEFVIGRVIKAMNFNWHPSCFVCQICSSQLADTGFVKSLGRCMRNYGFNNLRGSYLGVMGT